MIKFVYPQQKNLKGGLIRMDSITQDAYFRQRVVKYANNENKTRAAEKYHVSRMSVYRWCKRYDGTIESLKERSSRPKHHPNQHTEEEIRKIVKVHNHNKKYGLERLWVELKFEHGYTRSITALYRVMRRIGLYKQKKEKKKRRLSKPYERMNYAGQRVQIDVKYVPKECLTGSLTGKKLYQYTAIDEYSRYRYIALFEEHSSYSSVQFLKEMIKAFPFPVECIQTDNGREFTNKYISDKLNHFEIALKQLNIEHKLIRIATPRHNGKVERSHRTDEELFYSDRKFYSFKDAQKQIKQYLYKSNRQRLKVHGWRSAYDVLCDYLAVAV